MSETKKRSVSEVGVDNKKQAAWKKPKKSKKGGVSTSSNKKSKASPAPQRQRRHAEIVEESKVLWNQLRQKKNTNEENRQLMDQLMPLITGKVQEIALQHDASRVVQAAIKFGNAEERKLILSELCFEANNMVELAKSQYAHFVVIKVIKYCQDEESVRMLVKSLKGHMPKLAVHAVASRVVECLFVTLPPKQTAVLKLEFYGPHVSMFDRDNASQGDSKMPTLSSSILAAPNKEEMTRNFFTKLVNTGLEKALYGLTFFQELLAEYIDVASPNDIRSMAVTAADHSIHLLSTRAGTRVAAALVAYGSSKERKRIMKSLKGYIRSGLLHPHAYLAILRIVQLTDDTVSVQKNILNELLTNPSSKNPHGQNDKDKMQSPLLELALSDNASKLFLILLENDDNTRKKFLDPYEHSVLFLNPMVKESDKNGKQVEVSTSLKSPEVRRSELNKHIKEPLIELCCTYPDILLRSKPGALVLREVYSAFHPESVVKAVLNACEASLLSSDPESENKSTSLFEDRNAHLALKNLILNDIQVVMDDKLPAGAGLFSSGFYSHFEGRLGDVAKSNRGVFVVFALLKVPSLHDAVRKELICQKDDFAKRSKEQGSTAGYVALLNELKS